jgi:hypothetical protein
MSETILKATHEGELRIGSLVIPCAVLEDGSRVITQAGFLGAMGRSRRPPAGQGASVEQTPPFLAAKNLQPFISEELIRSMKPIKFKPLSSGGLRGTAFGFKGNIFPLVCRVYVDALQRGGKLIGRQVEIAERCKVVLNALQSVAIDALIDEATGYQDVRPKGELRRLLELYISKELLPWAERFPEEFYREMFRLRGWKFDQIDYQRKGPQGPRYAGKLTNMLVYDKLPFNIRQELEKLNPPREKGRRKVHHHRFLTGDIGQPHLEKHVAVVTALMRVSPNWRSFVRLFNRNFPPPQPALFEDMDDETEGGDE